MSQVGRCLLFGALTVIAALVGRSSTDEVLGLSLVWPLYGVGALWLATSPDLRTRLADTIGLVALTGLTILLDDGDWRRVVSAMLLVAVSSWTWVLVARGWNGRRPVLERPKDLGELVVVLAATAASALVAAGLRTWGMGLLPTYDLETFLLLLIRNASGILGPVVLGMLLLPYAGPGWRTAVGRGTSLASDRPVRRGLEAVAILLAGLGLAGQVFGDDPQPLSFAMVLVVVWAAFRWPPVAAVGFASVLGTVAVLATLQGRGQFATTGSDFESAAVAQAFLITLVLASLAITLDVEVRRAVTERALSAERTADSRATLFSAVIEHLDEGVTVVTSDDDYTVRNGAARRLTGLGDRHQPRWTDAEGQPLAPTDLPHARARAEDRVVRQTVRLQLPSGSDRHLEVSSIPVPGLGDDRRPVVVSTLRDITEHQEERDQLVSFAGVVAHDLKNPLTVIRGWSESLQEELSADGPPDVVALRSMVARVHAAAEQMRHFIDDLLGITIARDRPLQLETIDLSALAEEVAELRRTGDTHARIAVQPGMRVTGDRFLLRQLLDNLVGNAVKYVAPGVRPSVTIQARPADGELEVSVTDNGIGIPAEQRTRVFDSFVRADQASGYSGTGLGLAICRRVVDRHGGLIWVAEPAPGQTGTRICFTLPRDGRPA